MGESPLRQHLSLALLLSRCSAPCSETGDAGWRSGPVPPPVGCRSMSLSPSPSSAKGGGSTVWLAPLAGFNEISPLYTQQARNSVLATVTTQNQQNNYTVTPSFFWAPIIWCFHVPRTEGAPVPGREHLCPQPPARVGVVFVAPDSAAFWQKNQVPKLAPFIGGWVALPPKAKVTICGVKELVHQHIVLPLGYKNSLLLFKKKMFNFGVWEPIRNTRRSWTDHLVTLLQSSVSDLESKSKSKEGQGQNSSDI